jgi:hypothetical protein
VQGQRPLPLGLTVRMADKQLPANQAPQKSITATEIVSSATVNRKNQPNLKFTGRPIAQAEYAECARSGRRWLRRG